jgi:hypothetical protein
MSGQLHAPAALPWKRAPSTHFIGGWVDPGAGLDDMEKWKFLTLPGLELPALLVVQPVASRGRNKKGYIKTETMLEKK